MKRKKNYTHEEIYNWGVNKNEYQWTLNSEAGFIPYSWRVRVEKPFSVSFDEEEFKLPSLSQMVDIVELERIGLAINGSIVDKLREEIPYPDEINGQTKIMLQLSGIKELESPIESEKIQSILCVYGFDLDAPITCEFNPINYQYIYKGFQRYDFKKRRD